MYNRFRHGCSNCRLKTSSTLGKSGVCINVLAEELPRERDNSRNNARCMQVRWTMHNLDGQHQDIDRTHHECGKSRNKTW